MDQLGLFAKLGPDVQEKMLLETLAERETLAEEFPKDNAGYGAAIIPLHDWIVGVRKGVVEVLWPVTARGKGF